MFPVGIDEDTDDLASMVNRATDFLCAIERERARTRRIKVQTDHICTMRNCGDRVVHAGYSANFYPHTHFARYASEPSSATASASSDARGLPFFNRLSPTRKARAPD